MARAYVPESGIDRSTRLASDLDGLGVDRITLPSMAVSPVEKPGPAVVGYLSDGHGHVRIMQTADVDEYGAKKSERYQYSYRKKESRTWQRLGQYDAIARTGIIPLAIDSTIDSLYLLKSLDGRDALYSMKLDGSGTETLVASNKNVDIDDVVQVGHGQAVIGYTFADDRRHTVYFDPEFEKLATALGRVLPNQPIVNFVSASGDGSKLIIFGGSATNPGIYYFYDRASKHLNELVLARPDLEHHALGNVQAINYPAADGVSIPAYLTLPPGGAAGNLPAVVLPHGGPSARDEWGFDWLAQFLASRGYAVIQPNFRGSAGYGDAWLSQNGFKGWRTSISDISASARYLAAKGIADPKRIAILGWSYGGYAALQSAATEPALYRAAVAIAPVTDLSLLKADARDFSNSKLINDLTGSGEQVVSGSPLRKARLIRIPVLMFHGDRDGNVTIAHSERMAAALTNGSSSVELIRFPGLDHQLQDTDARRKMLQKIDDFLLRELAR